MYCNYILYAEALTWATPETSTTNATHQKSLGWELLKAFMVLIPLYISRPRTIQQQSNVVFSVF